MTHPKAARLAVVLVAALVAVTWLGFRAVRAFDVDRHTAEAAAVLSAPDTVSHRLPLVPARRISAQPAPPPGDAGAPEREGSPPPGWMRGAVHSPDRPQRDLHAELLLRSLSERERQVLRLLARGYSNRRIAEACYLSLNTVRTHVQNVLVKLGVHSKLEAAALAVRQGLVRIEDHPV